jgi:hypothetical protein
MDSDAEDEKALSDIERYGCHVIHVLEEGELPPFTYSEGIQQTSGAPEVVVIGLKKPIAHFVVNEYNRRIRIGERFAPGKLYTGFLEHFDIQFVVADRSHYEEYFGWNRWLYRGNGFEVLVARRRALRCDDGHRGETGGRVARSGADYDDVLCRVYRSPHGAHERGWVRRCQARRCCALSAGAHLSPIAGR